jgi:putative ABC transport system substrate-binding protein
MSRREFITVLTGATAWMSLARAQEARPVIGYLSGFEHSTMDDLPFFLSEGLKATGFIEGKNVSIEFRWADGHYDRLSMLMAELVGRNVSVIHATDLPAAFVAKTATKTIPIVFVSGADPIKMGLVESFSRPNGNLTGMTCYVGVAEPKRVELLHELLPNVKPFALL